MTINNLVAGFVTTLVGIQVLNELSNNLRKNGLMEIDNRTPQEKFADAITPVKPFI